jgi:hypothetical protein
MTHDDPFLQAIIDSLRLVERRKELETRERVLLSKHGEAWAVWRSHLAVTGVRHHLLAAREPDLAENRAPPRRRRGHAGKHPQASPRRTRSPVSW